MLTPELKAAAERLFAWMSDRPDGSCKVLSQGDACQCHLCDFNRLVDALKEPKSKANQIQYGGDHYHKYGDIQPWDVWSIWNLDPFQATIVRYIVRWKDKNGTGDLDKVQHYLQKYREEIDAGRIKIK